MRLELQYFNYYQSHNEITLVREIQALKYSVSTNVYQLPAIEVDVNIQLENKPVEIYFSPMRIVFIFAKPEHVEEAAQLVDKALLLVSELDSTARM